MSDDYGFVSPRGSKVAAELLRLAEEAGHDAAVVRTTVGGYYVPTDVAMRYEEGLGAKPEESVVEDAAQESSTPDDSWKVTDIKEWASAHEVDLGDATKKADLLAAIQAHKEE